MVLLLGLSIFKCSTMDHKKMLVELHFHLKVLLEHKQILVDVLKVSHVKNVACQR